MINLVNYVCKLDGAAAARIPSYFIVEAFKKSLIFENGETAVAMYTHQCWYGLLNLWRKGFFLLAKQKPIQT